MKILKLRDLELYIPELCNVRIFSPYRSPSGELDYVVVYCGSLCSDLSDDLRESFISTIQPGFYDVMTLCIFLKDR